MALITAVQVCGAPQLHKEPLAQAALPAFQQETSIFSWSEWPVSHPVPFVSIVPIASLTFDFPFLSRKDLSVKYPGDLPITLPNLLRFILHHSDPASAPQDLGISPPTQECVQSKAVLQREHISHVENAMQKLRSEMSSLRRTQEQVEGRLFSARRDGHRLLRRQRTLEQQHRLLRRHSQKLQALYLKKARELQELARASGTPLPEHTWLKILVATMERELEVQGGAKEPALQGKAHPNHSKSMGATQLPGDTPPPSTTSSTLASESKHENRTD